MVIILSAFLIFTVSSPQAEAKTMWGKVEIQKGMIGKVQILKDTDLFTVYKGKLKFVKKLKKGNEHGVYGETKNMGGLYKLSGINYVKKSSSIKYLKVPVVPVTYGNLKGSVTWQYNNYIGTKPDVGAKVFLIPEKFKNNNYKDLELFSMGITIPDKSNLHFAKVNGFGGYEIQDVPVGKYWILISSKNTTRNMDETTSFKPILLPLFGAKEYKTFELFNLSYSKHEYELIEIKKDKTLDFSHDFGNTYF
jgi:hypothetical protein